MEISVGFAGQVSQYLKRVYQNMAVEMFGKKQEDVIKDGFILKDEDFTGYDPSKWFTSSELVDSVPRLDRVFTEDRLEVLREGLTVTSLPPLVPWPVNMTDYYAGIRFDQTITGQDPGPEATSTVGAGGPVFPKAPGP